MRNKKYQGAALLHVVIAFAVVVIISTGIYFVVRQNHYEAANQQTKIQAYYLTLSGIEIAMGALLQEVVTGGVTTTLIEEYNQNPSKPALTDTITLEGGKKVNVVVEPKNILGDVWVQITSTSELESIYKVKCKNIGILKINAKNPAIMDWNVSLS